MGPICETCHHRKTVACASKCDVDCDVPSNAETCYIRELEDEVDGATSAWTTVKIMRDAIREAFPNIGDGCDQPAVLLNEVKKLRDEIKWLRGPEDADGIRATCEDGYLNVSWYADPQDAPEWWGKGLGFHTPMDQGYGSRVAAIINNLWRRSESPKMVTNAIDRLNRGPVRGPIREITEMRTCTRCHQPRTGGCYVCADNDEGQEFVCSACFEIENCTAGHERPKQ